MMISSMYTLLYLPLDKIDHSRRKEQHQQGQHHHPVNGSLFEFYNAFGDQHGLYADGKVEKTEKISSNCAAILPKVNSFKKNVPFTVVV